MDTICGGRLTAGAGGVPTEHFVGGWTRGRRVWPGVWLSRVIQPVVVSLRNSLVSCRRSVRVSGSSTRSWTASITLSSARSCLRPAGVIVTMSESHVLGLRHGRAGTAVASRPEGGDAGPVSLFSALRASVRACAGRRLLAARPSRRP
jgi:hypothetical protein